tara:strand:+ start:55 stop:399 length:345 start_codon:yes stop_codon:yes gene_type:complete
MRVRISYGVDIKNVPETVRGLISEANWALRDSLRMLERIDEDLDDCEANAEQVLETIDKIRKKLSEIDLTISDSEMIVSGLKNYYEGDNNVPERRPTMDSSGDATAQTTDSGQG